jgi:hypothetical protein
MTATVIDSPDKKPNDSKALLAYSREIGPMIRDLLYQKELLKDFKESNEKAIELSENLSNSQADLKLFLDSNEGSQEIIRRIKELEEDLKLAVKAASKVCDFKPAELKAYFTARAKEDAVEKVIDKGEKFDTLEEMLK